MRVNFKNGMVHMGTNNTIIKIRVFFFFLETNTHTHTHKGEENEF